MLEKERIESILKDHPEGLTQNRIIRDSKLSQYQVVKIISELKGENKVKVTKIGNIYLHVWILK